jgi:uncharacterized RDD family membrane protein YckC
MGDITPQALVGWFLAPAIVFSLAYPSILTRLSLGLLSPYVRADRRKRIYAALIDGFLVMSVAFAFGTTGNVAYLALAAAFGLLRDGIHGQSPGKFIMGLVVINVETGDVARWKDSGRRNVLFLLPGANIAAVVLEARTLLRDPQGQRLGDRFAQTQVIEGAGAAEVVKELQEWLLALTPQSGRGAGRRDRSPVRDRAA